MSRVGSAEAERVRSKPVSLKIRKALCGPLSFGAIPKVARTNILAGIPAQVRGRGATAKTGFRRGGYLSL
jgi:hypothetical protein